MTTFLLYGLILFLILLLDGIKKKGVSTKICDGILLLVILAVCLLRYDTTADYFNYVKLFTKIRLGDTDLETTEYGYVLVNQIFSASKYGYIYVFGLFSIVYILGFHHLFKRLDIVTLGWFFTITMMVLVGMNNTIRQASAMGLFALSLSFVEQKKLLSFILIIAIASLIHYSAVLCFLYYVLARYYVNDRVKNSVWIVIIVLFLYLSLSGFFVHYTVKLFELIPRYQHYVGFLHYGEAREVKSGLGVILMAILGVVVVLSRDRVDKKYSMYMNMAIIYFMLYIVFCDTYVIFRVVNYLQIFMVIALALILKSSNVVDYIKLFVILTASVWWMRYSDYNNREYLTVFSEERKAGEFYSRSLLIKGGQKDLTDTFIYNYE